MNRQLRKQKLANQRKLRIRAKIFGTLERPRVSIYRSNKHIFAQVIDDESGKVLASENDLKKKALAKVQSAVEVGKRLAASMKAKKINQATIDRGSYKYHGRVKSLVEALREQGIGV